MGTLQSPDVFMLRLYIVFILTLCPSTLFAEGKVKKNKSAKTSQLHKSDKTSFLRRRETNIQNNTVESASLNIFEGGNVTQSRIYGGTQVPVRRYPYLAALFWINPDTGKLRLICGGSLIAPTVVLTAAHCSDKINVAMLGIYDFTNINEIDYEYYVINPDQKVIYPSYDQTTQAGDFLLLTLDQPSKFYPITLNTNNLIPSDGQGLTVMGWGVTETGQQSSTPQEAVVEAMASSLCALRYKSSPIFENELCASGGSKRDSCQGDSGGPLIIKGGNAQEDTLVASVSWGYDCADLMYPGVYARVSSVKKWLKLLVPQARFDDINF